MSVVTCMDDRRPPSELPDQLVSLVGGAGVVQRGFDRCVVTIGVGEARPYVSAEWADALVVVLRGRLELVGRCGGGVHLRRGDVTWLSDLPLVTLRNAGDEVVELAAVRRCAPT